MKNFNLTQFFVLIAILFSLTGCEVIGGIFEAGMWAGIIIVVLVIVLIIWLLKKVF